MIRLASIAIAVALTISAPAAAIGPAVGTRAPAITAVDTSGKPRSLASLAGKSGTVLVFFRSAEWCPFCKAQIIGLNENAPAELARRGFGLAALSYDSPAILAAFAAERGITFPLLSDTGSRTIDAFGMRDPQYPAGNRAYGVPQPAMFVIGRDGRVRAVLMEAGYRTRPPLSALLAAVDALPAR